MPAKKPTAQSRAAEIGVSLPTLRLWKRTGIDVNDDDQVRAKISAMRNIPPTLNPTFQPSIKSVIATTEDPTQIDIEGIIHQLSTVTDKHQAQTVKLQIDGLLNSYKLLEAAGRYVAKATVEESLIRIGAAVKAAALRMEADLPPMLEGASPAEMQRVIRDKVDEMMRTLSDESSKVWEKDE